MTRIAIIVGHARYNTFYEALARAYRRGAQAAGHEATLFVTSAMTFDPVRRASRDTRRRTSAARGQAP
jgi:putative NADPH-quinone reductase